MKFDKSRVFSSVNADELKAGDKVIVADTIQKLEKKVYEKDIKTLVGIEGEGAWCRFDVGDNHNTLAYLVERKANCTNCGMKSECKDADIKEPELHNCLMWEKPKTEQKAKMPGLISLGNGQYAEKEKHYRPFKDIKELVKVWEEKTGATPYWGKGADLFMPHIWVRYKKEAGSKSRGHLIHGFYEDIIEIQDRTMSMEDLFYFCEFLDGSPCGVEE